MNQIKNSMVLLVLLGIVATSSLFTVVCSQSYPSSVLVPSTSITDAPLSCTGAPPLEWKVNGTTANSGTFLPGISFSIVNHVPTQTQTLSLTVQQTSILTYNGTAFQCRANGENFSSVPTAFIIVYGKLLALSRAHVTSCVLQVLPQNQLVYHQSCHQ